MNGRLRTDVCMRYSEIYFHPSYLLKSLLANGQYFGHNKIPLSFSEAICFELCYVII